MGDESGIFKESLRLSTRKSAVEEIPALLKCVGLESNRSDKSLG